MGYMKGQGATEYLVLLAVVLIIALVSIALLGFFPGLASDARITQSNTYWRGEARPFAILEHSVSTTTLTMVMQNVDATGTLTVTNISAGGSSVAPTGANASFAPGETKTVTITNIASVSSGSTYDLSVNITYTTPNGVSGKQYGAKGIVGKAV